MGEYKHKSALLIDDSYIDNLINRKILENNNFAENIIVMDSPQEAVKYLNDLIDTAQVLPGIIFLDLRMPEMSGFEVLKALKAREEQLDLTGTSIYVLSSSLDPTDLKRIEENNLVSKFIGKPLSKEILEEL